jgi:hypothetical protein
VIIPPPFTPQGYQTLREAFDAFGRERFPDSWTGNEVDEWEQARILDRWSTTLALFLQELEAGRIIVVALTEAGDLHEVRTNYWRMWEGDERLAEYLIEPDRPYYVIIPDEPQKPAPARAKGKPGRKPEADWPAYQGLFFEECDEHGLPDEEDNGWGSKAKAIEWLIKLVERDTKGRYTPGHETARDRINKFIEAYRVAKGRN